MRIGTPLPAQAILPANVRKPALMDAGDGEAAAGEGAPPPAMHSNQHLGSVQMLVTLAAFDPEKDRRREMAEQGNAGLDELETLHMELVGGGASPERLEQLAEWVSQVEQPDDPVLAEIVAGIELRVRVELAKFEVEV